MIRPVARILPLLLITSLAGIGARIGAPAPDFFGNRYAWCVPSSSGLPW
jgi:hypothetical protein